MSENQHPRMFLSSETPQRSHFGQGVKGPVCGGQQVKVKQHAPCSLSKVPLPTLQSSKLCCNHCWRKSDTDLNCCLMHSTKRHLHVFSLSCGARKNNFYVRVKLHRSPHVTLNRAEVQECHRFESIALQRCIPPLFFSIAGNGLQKGPNNRIRCYGSINANANTLLTSSNKQCRPLQFVRNPGILWFPLNSATIRTVPNWN